MDKHFIQTGEIDLSDYLSDGGAGHNGDKGWEPIGNNLSPFAGSYNGNNKAIKNLTINRPDENNVGLFGYVGYGATLKNVKLENADIQGNGAVGGLIGENYGDITDCSASGSVTAEGNNAGGLIGYNDRDITVSNSSATGAVLAASNAGGLIGFNSIATVTDCYATGMVNAANNAGGLIGEKDGGKIEDCYATGKVEATAACAGSLIGVNRPEYPYSDVENSVIKCYATGAVSAVYTEGGLIGDYGSGNVISCYWDTETTGQVDSFGGDGVVGKTTAEMTQQSTFTGWDFANIWLIKDGESYPYLQWQGAENIPFPLE